MKINPVVNTFFDPPAATDQPLDIDELVDLLNTLVHSQIEGSYIPYAIGTSAPSDEGIAWIQVDTDGKPLAIKIFYNGAWRRVYNGMVGEIRGYTGNPNTDFIWDVSNTNPDRGKFIEGGNYDGWYLCNGLHGTPNLTDRFVIGGHMDNSDGHAGYNGGWQTFVDGVSDLKTGGAAKSLIQHVYLPSINADGTGQIVLHGKEYKSSADHKPDFFPIIDFAYNAATNHVAPIVAYGSSPGNGQDPLPTLPPFYALAYIMFIGY
jgi:hypothetical protein